MRTIYFIMFAFFTANAFGQCADITQIDNWCASDNVVLFANPSNSTYQWFFNDEPVLQNGTNLVLIAREAGKYRVEVTLADGTLCSDSTFVGLVPNNIIYEVQDSDCDGFSTFDLTTQNFQFANGGSVDYSIQYFPSILDAQNDQNEIISNYTNLNAVDDTVAVKVINLIDNQCFEIGTMSINVIPQTTITSFIESTAPNASNNLIEICEGESVTFTAVFDTNYNYTWDFESLGTQTGRTVTQVFDEPGGYFVRLLSTDQNSCPSDPVDYVTVVVAQDPDTNYVAIDSPVLCLGDSLEINPESTTSPILVCNDADFVAGTTFLPDGSGVSYETSIEIDCFPDGALLNNTASFLGVCMTMEHSWLGDLEIQLIAPDGTTVALLSYPINYTNGEGGAFLGEPIDDNISISAPGIGYEYCFTTDAINNFRGPRRVSIPEGNYITSDPFSNLLGVPLNGTWRIKITDHLLADNGYIFNWFMKFGADLESTTGYSSPVIISESWATHPDITVLSTGGVTITPSQTGINCYDYTTTDASGCTFINQYCIEVRDPQTDFPTVDLYIYDSDANGTEDFNLDFNTDRLIGNMDAATTTITYYTSLADAQNQSNPIFNTDSFANTTNPQTIYASVNNSNLLCQNVIVDFNLILTNQPVTDSDNDTIPDLSEDLNGNGDLTDDDTDGDGIPNYLDDDDDGDGVPTAVETSGVGARGTNFTFIDTDGDGIENYLDNDDDGDGVLTEDEDYNGNGDPTDDDTDGSGIPDFLEGNVTLSIELLMSDDIIIYPNPFYENSFEIRYSNINSDKLEIALYNLNGASVLTQTHEIGASGTIRIETPNLSSGIYFLQLNTNQNSVYKLIKK